MIFGLNGRELPRRDSKMMMAIATLALISLLGLSTVMDHASGRQRLEEFLDPIALQRSIPMRVSARIHHVWRYVFERR